jgi:GNAT superfamily N-acetyltransferase
VTACRGRRNGFQVKPFAEVPNDSDVLAALHRVFFATSNTKSFADANARAAFRERWLDRYLAGWPGCCFLAEQRGGMVVGYVAGCPDNPSTSPGFTDHPYYTLFEEECRRFPAHLHINVLSDARGGGIGTALIEAFAKSCKAQEIAGCHAVTADGHRNNRFFESCGFTAQARATWHDTRLVFYGRTL